MLGLTGSPFWKEESYDHTVQNDLEFQRIESYIRRTLYEPAWSCRRGISMVERGMGDQGAACGLGGPPLFDTLSAFAKSPGFTGRFEGRGST